MAARPKSMMTTSPRLFIMMFCGLRSRWITPRSWAAASPAQSLRAVSRALSAGRRPMRVSRRGEVFAVHVLHGDERHALDFADIVHAADVGMRHQARHAHFAVEAFQQALVARGLLGQEFQGDGLAEREIGGAIDFAHAAAAQQRDDAIASAKQGAGKKAAFVFHRGSGTGDVLRGFGGQAVRRHRLGQGRSDLAVHSL